MCTRKEKVLEGMILTSVWFYNSMSDFFKKKFVHYNAGSCMTYDCKDIGRYISEMGRGWTIYWFDNMIVDILNDQLNDKFWDVVPRTKCKKRKTHVST